MRQLINIMCETMKITKKYVFLESRLLCSQSLKSISIFCLYKYYANFLWLYEKKRGHKRKKSNKDVSKMKVKRIFMLLMFVLLVTMLKSY